MTAPDLPFGAGLRHIEVVVALMTLSALEAVDAMLPLLHPDIRVLAAPGVAPAGGYADRTAFLGYFAAARAQGVLVRPDAHEIRVTPSGAVLAAGTLSLSGPAGVDETAAWFVYGFRDGQIIAFGTYLDPALAMAAADDPAGLFA